MPNYRKMFLDDPKDFFERYSISLPANPEEAGKIGQLELMRSTFKPVERAKDAVGIDATNSSAGKSFHKFQTQGSMTSVRISGLAHNAAWKVEEDPKRATLVVRTAASAVSRTEEESASLDWFLCLMLPWLENGKATMTLRRQSRANVFFTGAMNGCSFVVTGDPAEPIVSHINCNNADEYEDRYQEVLADAGGLARNSVRLGREAYKLDDPGKVAHEHVINEKLRLRNQKLVQPIITDTLCFVMGRRVGGRWEFFYQRVITQKYSYIDKLGKSGGLKKLLKMDDREVQSSVVYRSISSYNKLWPDGHGRLDV
jgi:hypothetical protein